MGGKYCLLGDSQVVDEHASLFGFSTKTFMPELFLVPICQWIKMFDGIYFISKIYSILIAIWKWRLITKHTVLFLDLRASHWRVNISFYRKRRFIIPRELTKQEELSDPGQFLQGPIKVPSILKTGTQPSLFFLSQFTVEENIFSDT